MILRAINNILVADYSEDLEKEDSNIKKIANNTENTWQKDRSSTEKELNTKQGKIAEDVVERCIVENHADTIECLSYDKIRNDDYLKHAPFDFLIWGKGSVDIGNIVASIQNDISSTNNSFVRLSNYTRGLCKEKNVKIVEVKSTIIRQKYKDKSGFNGDYSDDVEVRKLTDYIRKKDDVFCYPYYKRYDKSQDYTLLDYCNYVKKCEAFLSGFDGDDLKHRVIDLEKKQQCCDIFVRVYIDKEQKKGLVIGWLDRERLLDYYVVLKRMGQKDKSENALYFAKNLTKTDGINLLDKIFTNNKI